MKAEETKFDHSISESVRYKGVQLSHCMKPGKEKNNINLSSYSHEICTPGNQ